MALRSGSSAGSQPISKKEQGNNDQYPDQEHIENFQGDFEDIPLNVEDLYEWIIKQKKKENSG
jgi:hypothetical protein